MELENALQKIGSSTAIILLGTAAGTVLGYLLKVVLTRLLGPGSYGIYAQLLAVVGILAPIAAIGLHYAVPHLVSLHRENDEPAKARNTLLTALAITLFLSVLLAFLLHSTADLLATHVFSDAQMVQPLKLISFALPLLSLFHILLAYIRGRKDARSRIYIKDILLPLAQALAFLGLYWLGLQLEGAIYAYIIGLIAAIAAGIYALRNIELAGSIDLRFKKILLFSWPLLVTTIIAAIQQWTDVLMIGWFMESQYVGFYEIALAVGGIVTVFLAAINYMVKPISSELIANKKKEELRTLYSTVTRWAVSLSLPVLAGIIIFPETIIQVLFGQSYLPGAAVLPILTIASFTGVISGPVGILLIASSRQNSLMYAMLSAALLNIALNLFLIPRQGILGAAIAFIASLVTANGLLLFLVHRQVGIHPFSRTILLPFASILIVSIPARLLAGSFSPGIAGSLGIGLAMTVAYLYLLYTTGGITDRAKKLFRTLWKNASDKISL